MDGWWPFRPYPDGVTNRELYVAATELLARHAASDRSLAGFLRSLRAAFEPHHQAAGLTPDQFLDAIEQGLAGPALGPDRAWRLEDLSAGEEPADAVGVEKVLKSQVLDLEDAETSGAARDEYRFFGMAVGRPEAARRATSDHYYNWTPLSYVECGVVGAFGGWEVDDDTGRVLVPGDVAVLTDEGVVSMPADEVPSPVVELSMLSWSDVARFLWCGQHYE